MKRILTISLMALSLYANAYIGTWQQVDKVPSSSQQAVHPEKYLVYNLNVQELKAMLFSLPQDAESGRVISFPSPDGRIKQFKVWEAPMFEPGLSQQFPGIKTFTAVSLDNHNITAKLDFTVLGFHAMVFDGENTYFIDPYSNPADNYYLCYYKKDINSAIAGDLHCTVPDKNEAEEILEHKPVNIGNGLPPIHFKQHGSNRYTYRLAVACTGEYSKAAAGAATPSVAISLSAITTAINRINGVYEREVGVHMNLVANETSIIYLDGATDPYTNSDGFALQSENQSNLTAVIGGSNYDLGHVLCTSTTGVAQLACVCNPTVKAMGVSGQPNPIGAAFDIDFTAHELGHQFGAVHTFNAATSNCNGNGISSSAYEPGGGTTIMAYAGICGANNNLQAHSDDYFHARSLDQISDFLTSSGLVCASTASSNNNPPTVPVIAQTYYIPHLTPFELTSPIVADSDHDSLRYNWEQWDLGDFQASFADVKHDGPIFRSFPSSASATRIFPTLNKLRVNVTNYLGEKLPEVTRTLKFKMTARDMLNGFGTFDISDDELTLEAVSSSGPFKVIFPNVSSDYMQCGATSTITWDVANTTAAPVSCSNVDIYLSADDGLTFPYVLASNTPNDGSEVITVPLNIYSAGCRVKVKGNGNVFFDMSNQPFSVFPWPASVGVTKLNDNISIYPIPAKDAILINSDSQEVYDIIILNTLGQIVWQGAMNHQLTVNVQGWNSGVYYVRLTNSDKQSTVIKKIVVE